MSINGWSEGILNIFDILFGLPYFEKGNVENKLQEERMKFLVNELNSHEKENIEKIVNLLRQGKLLKSSDQMPRLPYIFSSLNNDRIDLSLHNHELRDTLNPILSQILKTESEGWVPGLKGSIISELREKNIEVREIQKRAKKRLREEYLARVCGAIRKNEVIQESGDGIDELLINQLKGEMICQESFQNVEDSIEIQVNAEEERLKMKHPVCSKIETWMERKLSEKKISLKNENQLTAHSKALESCQKEGLQMHSYFLTRDLLFNTNHAPLVRKELLDELKTPAKTFKFETRIWFPQNWQISQMINNRARKIRTVIHSNIEDSTSLEDEHRSTFIHSKYEVRRTSSGITFWRWKNFFHTVWSCLWNTLFYLGIVVPFRSQFSFRSLVSLEEFYPEYKLSQRNGALYKDPTSKTETLSSKLKVLWKHVDTKRKEFEATPDHGLLGKQLQGISTDSTTTSLKALLEAF